MINNIIKFVPNKQMQELFGVSNKLSWIRTFRGRTSVKSEVSVFFRSVCEQGSFVVRKGYSQYIEKLADSIAYECFCNELMFYPIKRYGCIKQTVEYILFNISKKLQKFNGRKFCVCLSIDENADRITCYFHTYSNEMLIDDIEAFNQPVLYAIVQT